MAEPTIPGEIKVGPYTYTVEPSARADGILGDRFGETDEANLRIRYLVDQNPGQLRATLLHEALHAVQNTVGIADDDKLSAEQMIRRTEAVTLGLLRDNPALVAYLTA